MKTRAAESQQEDTARAYSSDYNLTNNSQGLAIPSPRKTLSKLPHFKRNHSQTIIQHNLQSLADCKAQLIAQRKKSLNASDRPIEQQPNKVKLAQQRPSTHTYTADHSFIQKIQNDQNQTGSSNAKCIHALAQAGVSGQGQTIPHAEQMSKSFAGYDISTVQAYTNTQAKAACQQIGAEAYTVGNKIAFSESNPSVHTTAHELTHKFQQEKGVQLQDGIGRAGDRYERHADAVADRVVQGRSVTPLLEQFTKSHTLKQSQMQPLEETGLFQTENNVFTNKVSCMQCQPHSRYLANRSVGIGGRQKAVQFIPTNMNFDDYDKGKVTYTPGTFATTEAAVCTTSGNHHANSRPAVPTNANRIKNGKWNTVSYQGPANPGAGAIAGAAYIGKETIVSIQGGISAGAAANQLTKIHIIHHALGKGTNRNPDNIFWGNPGFNNPRIFAEESKMLDHLKNGYLAGVLGGSVSLKLSYFHNTGNNNVVEHKNAWYAQHPINTIATPKNILPKPVPGVAPTALYQTIDDAFSNPGHDYMEVDMTKVPHVATYKMEVKYGNNGMALATITNNLENAVINEYNNRVTPNWIGEDDTIVKQEIADIANEAHHSISREVNIDQDHEVMEWDNPTANPAPAKSSKSIDNATSWKSNPLATATIRDGAKPKFKIKMNYYDTANAKKTVQSLGDWV